MLFNPQICNLKDEKFLPFISVEEIETILRNTQNPSVERIRAVVERSLGLNRLSMEETALLLNARGEEAGQIILEGARMLKRKVYGERIVLFAPLYIGNRCINNCAYCGFRTSNRDALRRTLSDAEIESEVRGLEEAGQKRLILVYGEHPDYSPEYIAHTVKLVYGVHQDNGRINRVNINAAPLDVEGFRTVKEAGIGTYQIFQETYHPETYRRFHLGGRKMDYHWRLTAMDRAMEAGIDDVGLGVLFGLGDWRFEVLALVRHVNHLEACFGVGPHTISFPRIQNASNLDRKELTPVNDDDFTRLVAVLRLAVPYTGLILTAREPRQLRDRLIGFGVSQIDAGTQLEIGGYTEYAQKTAIRKASGSGPEAQNLHREQFELMDTRSLAETIGQLVETGQIPSFCTACYRKGRTGEHFMEFSTKGFIKRYCTPNALLTFAEWLEDYADDDLRSRGWRLIDQKTEEIDPERKEMVVRLLDRIRGGERDLLL